MDILLSLFFFNDPATTEIYTLSLHDALPIWQRRSEPDDQAGDQAVRVVSRSEPRSEEHTSELQSQFHLVCRLLLEKKKGRLYSLDRLTIPILCDSHQPAGTAPARCDIRLDTL